ncbi:MAG: pentapeptide repeat-containing protein [Pseudomonadota bacterium]
MMFFRLSRTDSIELLALCFLAIGVTLYSLGLLIDLRSAGEVLRVFIDEWSSGFVVDGTLLLVMNRLIKNNERNNVLAQLGSYSNDFALDALRRARQEGWLSDGTLRGRSFSKARLHGADFSGATLAGTDLRYADLSRASLTHSDLQGADLTGANLTDADLRWANLSNATLDWVLLTGAQLEGANLKGMSIAHATFDADCPELAGVHTPGTCEPLSEEQIGILRSTLGQIEAAQSNVIDQFYEHLFEERPELRTMFSSSQSRQSRKLLQSLKIIIDSMSKPDRSIELLEQLGIRHAGYGVKAQHYELAGRVLLRTLASYFGDQFTPKVAESWRAAFALIATVMVHASADAQAT